jgi:hypothetical protein
MSNPNKSIITFFDIDKVKPINHLENRFKQNWPIKALKNIILAEGLTPHQVAFSGSEELCEALGLFSMAETDEALKTNLKRRFKNRYE